MTGLSNATAQQPAYRLLSAADLANLPQPEFLIGGILPARGFSVLYGPSGGGKTFLALDWALCIAEGLPWYGHAARQGAVLYIAAEGVGGLHRRITAWQHARNRPTPDGIRFLPAAVNFLEPDQLAKAHHTLERMTTAPVLIAIDTMARTMTGGDENAARDVGQFIANVDKLRRGVNAAALVVHHTGKNGDDERGSSALRGAADMMASLKPDGASLRLACSKMKEAEPFDPWTLHLTPTAESCVLRLGSNPEALSDAEHRILESLPAGFGSDRAPAGRLQKVAALSERTFYRALQSLEQRGYIDHKPQGRSKLYGLTPEGHTALLPTTANHCQAANGITAANAATLGAAVGSHPGSNGRVPGGVA